MAIAPTQGQTGLFAVIRELLELRAGDDYDLYGRTVNPRFMRLLKAIGFDGNWARGDGQYLYDESGKRFLDMLGGFGMFTVGRNNAYVRGALVDALTLSTSAARRLPQRLAAELLERSAAPFARVIFTASGTEAVSTGIRLGRRATQRQRVLGTTPGRVRVDLPGFDRVRFGDLDELERQLRRGDVAVFLVEPVQATGVILPPAGYLEGAQELCRRWGTLFMLDEVQTAFGRTGKLFAYEHWNLQPDLVVVGKSLSGGYVPIGALLATERIGDCGSPFGANDLAVAAGLAALHELEDARLLERACRLGELLLERTRPLISEHAVVRDVRGLGLMWAIEFAEPPDGSRPWRLLQRAQDGIFSQLVVVPLFTHHRIVCQVAGHRLPIVKALPPLVLSEQDVAEFAAALDDVIGKAMRPLRVGRIAMRAAFAR